MRYDRSHTTISRCGALRSASVIRSYSTPFALEDASGRETAINLRIVSGGGDGGATNGSESTMICSSLTICRLRLSVEQLGQRLTWINKKFNFFFSFTIKRIDVILPISVSIIIDRIDSYYFWFFLEKRK